MTPSIVVSYDGTPDDEDAIALGKVFAQRGASISIASVELLGSADKVTWNQTADALEVTLPGGATCKYAYTLKLTPGQK